MDKRPTLQLLQGGASAPVLSGDVCRTYGCAEESIDLGYCVSCLEIYPAKRRLNADRYAALVESAAERFHFGTFDPIFHRIFAAELIDAQASEDYAEASHLLWGIGS